MKTGNNSSKFSRMICMVVTAVFMFTTIAMPVYGLDDMESGDAVPQPVSAGASDVQVYEESASSWRFQDGYNIAEPQDDGISPNTATARAAFIPWSKTDKGYINSKGDVIEGAVAKGIDVSSWQGKNINWDKVKADGIEFAILRCGYGSDEPGQDDSCFKRNVQECERVGIPYGVYLYSYANTEKKARNEAAHTLRLIKDAGADPDYPVYYDLEDDVTLKVGRTKIIKYAEIYCEAIEAAGYDAGIYASLTWWNKYLNSTSLDKYDKWIAQWNPICTYEGEYGIWQYTSSGTVDGISGRVDMNFSYHDPEPKTGFHTISNIKYYYDADGKLQKNKWIEADGKKYYAKASGAIATGYVKIDGFYYLFDSEGVMQKGTVTLNGKQYKLYSTGRACIHTAKTKTGVNYRTGPGTKYKKKGVYKKGKTVYVMKTSNGWSRLASGYWVKSSYLKKVTTYPKTVTTFKKYKVKTTDGINYRTGPGTSYKKKGTYNKGKTLTIVATKNGWGKTSTGYWVKLSYTKKI